MAGCVGTFPQSSAYHIYLSDAMCEKERRSLHWTCTGFNNVNYVANVHMQLCLIYPRAI